MADNEINYILIQEVERRPYLYNYNLPEYSNKALNDKAWREIAKKTNTNVGEIKEKWRNMRSTFTRTVRPGLSRSGLKPKKAYYLAKHLEFILPFMRPMQNTNTTNTNNEVEEIKCEGDETNQSHGDGVPSDGSTDDEDISQSFEDPLQTTRRKRRIDEADGTILEYANSTKESWKETPSTPTHPMQYFFLSLLGEFDTMTEDQMRHFKIRVLQLIDEMKRRKATDLEQISIKVHNCSESKDPKSDLL